MKLHRPIGVFDAGIGSYAIVERVRRRFSSQDIVYFADRASFPYGTKTPQQLLQSVRAATEYLQRQGCEAVVLASNAPSIVVLDDLRKAVSVPVIGVFPPVREALEKSVSKHVAILGVQSMVTSAAMQAYVAKNTLQHDSVVLSNASSLVDLVENFDFLNNPEFTQQTVNNFIAKLLSEHPTLDVMTMSSTHLPWLKSFFVTAAPQVTFLDPADSVLAQLEPYVSDGGGVTQCLATGTEKLSLSAFNDALASLRTSLTATLVETLVL
ncbi:glutamate racemase [Undibacterium sp. SXout11W]|uniref:glutamate racemase n=1 Tax=Undibacterium sp. SXout11W TaxID=3413050 RepID=UPI003BF2390A